MLCCARDTSNASKKRPDSASLRIPVGALPTVLGDIEDHAIGILELALKIAVPLLAKVEEEFAAVGLDTLLRFNEIVDLKAERRTVRPYPRRSRTADFDP